jgi:hypothetical protein
LRSRILAAAILLGLATASSAEAQQPAPLAAPTAKPFAWVVDFSLEYGGDVLVTLLFLDGSTQDLHAGQGGTASFGFDYRPARWPQLGLRTTAGVKFVTNASDNADVSFRRIPIEIVGSYYLPKDWRVGAGLAYHLGNSFNGDGYVPDIEFDPAAGATLELGWKWVALTYTTMQYSVGGPSLDASTLGVSLNWVFGRR